MDDLVSRRAAIDAAIEATDSWEGFCNIGRQKRIENYINSLPFAPGMDLISRQAAIDICANVIDLFRGQFGAGALVAIKESIEELPSAQPEQRYTEEELRVFAHGISLSLLSKRSAQHWQYDEDTATEIKFLERLYDKVSADMKGGQG